MAEKRVWPWPDIVTMTPHRNGQWCKKIRGKLHYFGADPRDALARWREIGEALMEGRQPEPVTSEGVTVRELVNVYLDHKRKRHQAGRLHRRTYDDYVAVGKMVIKAFGSDRRVDDLRPLDFTRFADSLNLGDVRRGNVINMTRMIFNWGDDHGLIERVRFGGGFRRQAGKGGGRAVKLFEPVQVRQMIDHAPSDQMRAMILLGINCGFGNTDCAALPLDAVNLDAGTVLFARPKTGVERPAIPLWPETLASLRTAIDGRPRSAAAEHDGLVFLTRLGQPWIRPPRTDAISAEFTKLLKALGNHQQGVSFYTLRRTFRTWADASGDQRACDAIMGHRTPGMGTTYVQRIEGERIAHVVKLVRTRLDSPAHQ